MNDLTYIWTVTPIPNATVATTTYNCEDVEKTLIYYPLSPHPLNHGTYLLIEIVANLEHPLVP